MSDELAARAAAAREHARAPYSNFKVGAAIRTAGGEIYSGCNIENSTLGLTVCAERVALWKALSEGGNSFSEIVIVTDTGSITPPCGACRQLLWEYCGNITVRLRTTGGAEEILQLAGLLPHPFSNHNLR